MKTQRTDHCCILKIPFFPWQMGKGEKLGGICKWFFIFVVCPPHPDLKTIISSINEEILYGALFVRQKAYFISVTNKHSHVTLQIQFKKKNYNCLMATSKTLFFKTNYLESNIQIPLFSPYHSFVQKKKLRAT